MGSRGTSSIEYGVIAMVLAVALMFVLPALGHAVAQPFAAALVGFGK